MERNFDKNKQTNERKFPQKEYLKCLGVESQFRKRIGAVRVAQGGYSRHPRRIVGQAAVVAAAAAAGR